VAGSALALPCRDVAFDLVICNQVYQYVGDVAGLFAEIARVLKPRGLCFFSARNLWGLAARENCLPWLATLSPRMVCWLEQVGIVRGDWRFTAGQLRPYHQLRALAAQHFEVLDFTVRVLTSPTLAPFYLSGPAARTLMRWLGPILPLVKPILPTHLWILVKP